MDLMWRKRIGVWAIVLGLGAVVNVQNTYASPSTSFQYVTTSAQSYVVPADVTLIYVEVRGGDGAGAFLPLACGGSGALVTTTLVVTPGEVLDVFVAGRGLPGNGPGTRSTGGWGFGSGGDGDGYGAGGGGGGTAIMRGVTPLVVAGGGGGSGWATGATGGSAGTTLSGGAAGGGNADAGAGADGTGAGAPGTRPGSSWAAGGDGSPGGIRPNTSKLTDVGRVGGTGGGGYGGGAAASGSGVISGGGGGGSMSSGSATRISTAPYGVECVNGGNDLNLRIGAHGYVIVTPVDSPVEPAPIESPPDVLQQVGAPRDSSCEDFSDVSLNWADVPSHGWTLSWAQWVNSGLGGPVCTRTLYWVRGGTWSVRT